MITGKYRDASLAWLQAKETKLSEQYDKILDACQSYQIAGRSFSRAPLEIVAAELAEVQWAIKFQGGTVHRAIYADMSGS